MLHLPDGRAQVKVAVTSTLVEHCVLTARFHALAGAQGRRLPRAPIATARAVLGLSRGVR